MLSAVSNQKATAHLAEVRAVLGEGNASDIQSQEMF